MQGLTTARLTRLPPGHGDATLWQRNLQLRATAPKRDQNDSPTRHPGTVTPPSGSETFSGAATPPHHAPPGTAISNPDRRKLQMRATAPNRQPQ